MKGKKEDLRQVKQKPMPKGPGKSLVTYDAHKMESGGKAVKAASLKHTK